MPPSRLQEEAIGESSPALTPKPPDSEPPQVLLEAAQRRESREAVQIFTMGRDCPCPEVDFDWDMRLFRDPDSDWSIKHHDGHHHHIIQRLMAHRHFKEWLREVSQCLGTIDDVTHEYPRGLRIALWCHRGRHRSVAGAVVLKAILEKAL